MSFSYKLERWVSMDCQWVILSIIRKYWRGDRKKKAKKAKNLKNLNSDKVNCRKIKIKINKTGKVNKTSKLN